MTAQEVVHKNLDAFNHHDMNAFVSSYATNAVAYDPQYTENLSGREAICKDAEDFILAFPDIQAKVIRIIGTGDTVAIEMEMSGTHTGPLISPDGTIPATNRSLAMRIGRFIRIDSQGAITEDNRYYDTSGIAQQLGLS